MAKIRFRSFTKSIATLASSTTKLLSLIQVVFHLPKTGKSKRFSPKACKKKYHAIGSPKTITKKTITIGLLLFIIIQKKIMPN